MTSVPVVARMARGAFAGAAATAAMGLVMLGARRAGFVGELAPEEITEAGLDAAGAERSEQSENALATAAHFAYGAGNGALYSLVAPRLPGPPLMRGLTFAAGLLFVSYEGWVPAARILPPLHAQTSGGRWTLVAGHLVYGATLARLAP